MDQNLAERLKGADDGSSVYRPRIDRAYGETRNFFSNKYIYMVISQRAGGLALGVNLTPTKVCNFKCVYCEISRDVQLPEEEVDLDRLSTELKKMLTFVQAGKVRELPEYRAVPEELLQLKMVSLSGDGEPTLCPIFHEVVNEVIHVRAQGDIPFFKIVLITNASRLDNPQVKKGIALLSHQDEIWAKLDAGTQEYMNKINRPSVTIDKVISNILEIAKERPVVIQSLFPMINDEEPPASEIEQYIARLQQLKSAGAKIQLVQIYSAHRPTATLELACRHLSLKALSAIASSVRSATGLRAEVF